MRHPSFQDSPALTRPSDQDHSRLPQHQRPRAIISPRAGSPPAFANAPPALLALILCLMAASFPSTPACGAISAEVQILFAFGAGPDAGRIPRGKLVENSDGCLYGTTSLGGTDGQGTIYRLKKDGSGLVVLHNFSKTRPGVGATPFAGLIKDPTSTLYGTTLSGTHDALAGAVFSIRNDGTDYKILRPFQAQPGEPRTPVADLLLASNNRLYGVSQGGAPRNMGCLFALNPDGSSFSILHEFTGRPADGGGPVSALVESLDGFLCGTTPYGGQNNAGTVFRLSKHGSNFSIPFHFPGGLGGASPEAALIETTNGLFYGSTATGGAHNLGVLFKLEINTGVFQIIHHFAGPPNDGANPSFNLCSVKAGLLAGTTKAGGRLGLGWLFLLSAPDARVIPLHSFSGLAPDGIEPAGPLLHASDGALYGITARGGLHGLGTLFRVRLTDLK